MNPQKKTTTTPETTDCLIPAELSTLIVNISELTDGNLFHEIVYCLSAAGEFLNGETLEKSDVESIDFEDDDEGKVTLDIKLSKSGSIIVKLSSPSIDTVYTILRKNGPFYTVPYIPVTIEQSKKMDNFFFILIYKY